MQFICNRELVVVSKVAGRSVRFEKGVPTHVPQRMWREVQAQGAVPVEEIIEEAVVTPPQPDEPEERKEIAFQAFDTLMKANDREAFSGAGAPTITAVEKLTNLKLSAKERDVFWDEFRQAKLKNVGEESTTE